MEQNSDFKSKSEKKKMPKTFRPKKEERVFVIHGDSLGQTIYAAKVRGF